MSRTPTRTSFVCRECGFETPRWAGKCPQCYQWNTLDQTPIKFTGTAGNRFDTKTDTPQELASLKKTKVPRILLKSNELNRVLGGGIVPGSLILIGGEPGIGKSTLLLQCVASIESSSRPIIYVSGEESKQQIQLRAQRLGIDGKGIYILTTNRFSNFDKIELSY